MFVSRMQILFVAALILGCQNPETCSKEAPAATEPDRVLTRL